MIHLPTAHDSPLRYNYAVWMKTMLGQPSHAVTLTFKRIDKSTGQCWNLEIVKKSCRVFLAILNKKLFGNSAIRQGKCIGAAVILDRGRFKCNPHAHLALVAPSDMSFEVFEGLIHISARLTWWVKGEGHVKAYWSEGWLGYMIDHGSDCLLLDLCTTGKR